MARKGPSTSSSVAAAAGAAVLLLSLVAGTILGWQALLGAPPARGDGAMAHAASSTAGLRARAPRSAVAAAPTRDQFTPRVTADVPRPALASLGAAYAQMVGSSLAGSQHQSSPFRHDGLCSSAAGKVLPPGRLAYLASFAPVSARHHHLLAHPAVPQRAYAAVEQQLERVHTRATKELGMTAAPPLILLYPNAAELREKSCASAHAVAYYDGAIHLAVMDTVPELLRSLRHEYAHHVLTNNGVGAPLWFQEGTALHFADDAPRDAYQRVRLRPLPLSAMVDTFPHTASLAEATDFYAQAYVMSDLLARLCLTRERCNPAELANALTSGTTTPEALFAWATNERGRDLLPTVRRSLWEDYLAHGDFPPTTKTALLQRASLTR